jgi:hypothetical protein
MLATRKEFFHGSAGFEYFNLPKMSRKKFLDHSLYYGLMAQWSDGVQMTTGTAGVRPDDHFVKTIGNV